MFGKPNFVVEGLALCFVFGKSLALILIHRPAIMTKVSPVNQVLKQCHKLGHDTSSIFFKILIQPLGTVEFELLMIQLSDGTTVHNRPCPPLHYTFRKFLFTINYLPLNRSAIWQLHILMPYQLKYGFPKFSVPSYMCRQYTIWH